MKFSVKPEADFHKGSRSQGMSPVRLRLFSDLFADIWVIEFSNPGRYPGRPVLTGDLNRSD